MSNSDLLSNFSKSCTQEIHHRFWVIGGELARKSTSRKAVWNLHLTKVWKKKKIARRQPIIPFMWFNKLWFEESAHFKAPCFILWVYTFNHSFSRRWKILQEVCVLAAWKQSNQVAFYAEWPLLIRRVMSPQTLFSFSHLEKNDNLLWTTVSI